MHDALQVLIDECWRGCRWVVETDIADCFSAIPQAKLMQAVQERVCDQGVLRLLRAMLRAGVLEERLEQLSGLGREPTMFMTMQHSTRRRRLRPMRRALARHRAGDGE